MTLFKRPLREAGYSQQGWYLVKGEKGNYSTKIVVVTELEQILDNGKPKQGRERWKDRVSSPSVSSWSDFMSTLLKGQPPGKYRAFLFGFAEGAMTNVYEPWRREAKIEGLRNAIRNGARLPIDES